MLCTFLGPSFKGPAPCDLYQKRGVVVLSTFLFIVKKILTVLELSVQVFGTKPET